MVQTRVTLFAEARVSPVMLKRPPGRYLIVNNDYDQVWEDGRTNISRNTRNGVAYGAPSGKAVPATARFTDDRFVLFTCPLQEWVHDMCSERVPGMSEDQRKRDFAGYFRDNVWMSNKAGIWSRQDCINKTLVGSGFPQLQPMATGGAVLRWVGETSKEYLVEAINPLGNFRVYHWRTHPWLFFTPTMSARYWLDRELKEEKENPDYRPYHPDRTTPKQEWYQEPIHFYSYRAIMAVFGFIPDQRSSTGFVNRVPKVRCHFLGEDQPVPNPFIMRFGRAMPNPYEGF